MAEVRRRKTKIAKGKKRKRSSNSRKNAQKRLLSIIGFGVLVVVVIAGVLMKRVLNLPQTSPQETQVVETPESQPLHPRLEPLLSIAQTYGLNAEPATVPNRPIPADVLLLPGVDMNGDGEMETIAARINTSNIVLDRSLREAGFNTIINSLIVIQGDKAFLRIDEYAMRDHLNRRIINQVPAPHGYAMRIYEFEDFYGETPFKQPVTVFDLVIIDEFGRGMSDEITLYWRPSTNQVAATNTFGAPDTF
jgi:hypothetical protein